MFNQEDNIYKELGSNNAYTLRVSRPLDEFQLHYYPIRNFEKPTKRLKAKNHFS